MDISWTPRAHLQQRTFEKMQSIQSRLGRICTHAGVLISMELSCPLTQSYITARCKTRCLWVSKISASIRGTWGRASSMLCCSFRDDVVNQFISHWRLSWKCWKPPWAGCCEMGARDFWFARYYFISPHREY